MNAFSERKLSRFTDGGLLSPSTLNNQKPRKGIIAFILILLFTANLYGQDISKGAVDNPRTKRPFGINFNLGGPTYIASASLDYFILPVLNIETGAGIRGYYIGTKYHFKGKRNNSTIAYTGALLSVYPPFSR